MKKQRLFLTGLMGSGKTRVGKLLAKRLGWRFLDTDEMVEEAAGMSVAAIFRRWGEPKFRILETQALKRALGGSPAVVATGGGLVVSASNRRLMRGQGLSVHLRLPLPRLLARLSKQGLKKRPLLAAGPQALRVLAKQRAEAYRKADLQIAADALPEVVLERILRQIRAKKPRFYLPEQGNLDT